MIQAEPMLTVPAGTITTTATGTITSAPTVVYVHPYPGFRGFCWHIAGVYCDNCRPQLVSPVCPQCTPRCPHGYPINTQPVITWGNATSAAGIDNKGKPIVS